MLITTSNICHYLIAKGVISSESVVDGDFAVIDVSGRNLNFKVMRGRTSGYFLKQIQHWDPQTVAMLQCEAACYWLARNDADFAALADLMPDFHWYDSDRHILVTRLIPRSENLYEHFRRVGRFPAGVAGKLGKVLGICHRETGDGLRDSPHKAIFPKQTPWILLEDRRNSHPFKELSPATSELFERVDKSLELRQALDGLRTDWHTDALIHGDMRLENCILFRSGKAGELSLKIVDWELADIGDPCWDVGAIIQAFLSASIMGPAINAQGQLPTIRFQAICELNGTQSAIRSLWKNYVSARGIEATGSTGLLERSLRYAAARMIQAAYEYVQFSHEVSPKTSYLFQVSSDILKNPGEAVRQLLDVESA